MKSLSIIGIIIITAQTTFAQAPLVKMWDKRFGGTEHDQIDWLQQTSDGGCILGGVSQSNIGGDKTEPSWGSNDFWFLKIDPNGNKQWDKRFGGQGEDLFPVLLPIGDGGYIFGGTTSSIISGDVTQSTPAPMIIGGDFWIIKTDSSRNKQWDKRLGGTKEDWLYSLYPTTDKGYMLGGFSKSGLSGDKTQPNWDSTLETFDYWIVKIDSAGNKQWDKRYGGIDDDRLSACLPTSDGGYILGGWSNSGNNGDKSQPSWGEYDYWVVKVDSVGSKQWDKRYGGTKGEHLTSIRQTADGGYILGGMTYSGISGDKTQPNWDASRTTRDFWIVKTDSVGNK